MTLSQTAKTLPLLVFGSTLSSNVGFQIGWAVLRFVAGLLMIHNGLGKLGDVDGFASYVVSQTMGLPFPMVLTYLAAYTEIVGAGLLMVGLLTRPAAIALCFTMLMALYFHICEEGFVLKSCETAILYGTCYLFCAINGGGLLSLDHFIAKQLQPDSSS